MDTQCGSRERLTFYNKSEFTGIIVQYMHGGYLSVLVGEA